MQVDRRSIIVLGVAGAAMAGLPCAKAANFAMEPADRLAIEQLLKRCAWALDTANPAEAVATFEHDATIVDANGKVFSDQNGGPGAYAQSNLSTALGSTETHIQINRVAPHQYGILVESYWSQVGWSIPEPAPRLVALGSFADIVSLRTGKWLIASRKSERWDSETVAVQRVREEVQ